jgi:hypothetical protein
MFKAITRTGSYQKHNVSISGGSKNANFRITGVYGKDNSLYIKEGGENYAVNVVSDFRKGIFGFGETMTIGRNLTHNSDMLKLIAIKWSTACPIYDPSSPTGYAGAALGTDMENPRATADNTWSRSEANTMSGNAWVTAEPLKGLVYKFNLVRTCIVTTTVPTIPTIPLRHNATRPDPDSMTNSAATVFPIEQPNTFDHRQGRNPPQRHGGITSEETRLWLQRHAMAMPSQEVPHPRATQKANSRWWAAQSRTPRCILTWHVPCIICRQLISRPMCAATAAPTCSPSSLRHLHLSRQPGV